MEKFRIPARVHTPGEAHRFIKQADHPPTKSVSLRYASLWALGARDSLPQASLDFLEEWCRQHHDECRLFPDPTYLESLRFATRLRDCPEAGENVAHYPGNRNLGTPSYSEVYHMVWTEQRWPELCKVLSGS